MRPASIPTLKAAAAALLIHLPAAALAQGAADCPAPGAGASMPDGHGAGHGVHAGQGGAEGHRMHGAHGAAEGHRAGSAHGGPGECPAPGAAAQPMEGRGDMAAGHGAGHGAGHAAGHGAGPGPSRPAAGMPVEVGQGAFAAVAEIVGLLQADPATDWARVDIAALVAHLRDMNAVMTALSPETSAIPGGLRVAIDRAAPGGGAGWRMTEAHMPVVAAELDLDVTLTFDGDLLIAEVVGEGPAAEAMIRGLGYHGLMATGAHHQPHHLAIASGGNPHVH